MSLAALAFLASALVPAQPTSFETVNLRVNSDTCNFGASTVRVTMAANVIRVTRSGDNCSPPGAPWAADVRLGAFPAGDYRVELFSSQNTGLPPVETFTFQVRDPVEVAVFPAPSRPLTDYTGLWYNQQESGWGLSLYQGPTHGVFGVLFLYDASNRPEWYSLQGGRWTAPTIWTGTLLRTTGPSYGGSFNSAQVAYTQVGTATLDFTQPPGQEGRGRLTYSIGNASVTTTVVRMPL